MWKINCHISTQEDKTTNSILGGKEDYKYHLDVGKVKGCIKNVNNNNPNLWGRESIN